MKYHTLTLSPFIAAILATSSCQSNLEEVATSASLRGDASTGDSHHHGDAKVVHSDSTSSTKTTSSGPKPYPLSTCIVSDEPLGSMGKPIVKVHNGQTVKFCCRGCVGDFEENPDTYLTKL